MWDGLADFLDAVCRRRPLLAGSSRRAVQTHRRKAATRGLTSREVRSAPRRSLMAGSCQPMGASEMAVPTAKRSPLTP